MRIVVLLHGLNPRCEPRETPCIGLHNANHAIVQLTTNGREIQGAQLRTLRLDVEEKNAPRNRESIVHSNHVAMSGLQFTRILVQGDWAWALAEL